MNEAFIDELLSRSVREILPSKELLKERLLSGDKLRIYIGTDATGTSLHLGHSTNYLILEKFRQLGHEVIFLIGDFTSRIGDPTDKTAARVQQTRDDVVNNVKTWLDQIRPIVNLDDPVNPVQIKYNHDWLSVLTFEDIINLASHFTVQHMLERDMFEKRLNENKPIFLHEFFYPLMQGYDSVAMDVDIEMCGSDQTFNALAGRTLQRKYNNKEKFVFVTTLLENPVTKQKMMSKSLGTGVWLDSTPNDFYGGIMSQPDENIHQLFTYTTLLPLSEINTITTTQSPMEAKKRLAFEITRMYRGEDAATAAAADFVTRIQNREVPTDIPAHTASAATLSIVDALVECGLVQSKSEARRKIAEGAIYHNGERVVDSDLILTITADTETLLKFGRRYVKIQHSVQNK